jgi:hypothetical protein
MREMIGRYWRFLENIFIAENSKRAKMGTIKS